MALKFFSNILALQKLQSHIKRERDRDMWESVVCTLPKKLIHIGGAFA